MEELAKSDIFFFITAVAVVVVAIFLIVVLVYLIRILRDVRSLSHKVKEEGSKIIDDVEYVRSNIKRGTNVKKIINTFASKHSKKRRANKNKE